MAESLRELTGAGPSQVGIVKAMRARDVSRPTEAELAATEEAQVEDPGSGGSVPVSS